MLAQTRQNIAVKAARIMQESGVRDYALAKQKAAESLGYRHNRYLPSNAEIFAELKLQKQLFGTADDAQHLQYLREQAIQAMQLLAPFHPRLVGGVLDGSADQYSAICLHVFADAELDIHWHLQKHRIPFDCGERKLRYRKDALETCPTLTFVAGETPVDLTVFTERDRRQAPLDTVTGKPMHRAKIAEIESLLTQHSDHSDFSLG